MQTPQYYSNARGSPICTAAAVQQNLFFGPIARGKDGVGAMMCCGTNVVFRRDALDDVGGFPEASLTEDFLLSVEMQERGWKTAYVSEVVASGLGPEDMASYVSQQQRWARGCLSAIPAVLRARGCRGGLASSTCCRPRYFLSGWTLRAVHVAAGVRLLFGIQPLASITANQFLIHFAPYYCGALAAVALAGSGELHVRRIRAVGVQLLDSRPGDARSPAPPRGPFRGHAEARRASPPAGGGGAGADRGRRAGRGEPYGLAADRGPATLNNVAFAALHSSVLLIGAVPALRLRRSPLLAPDRAGLASRRRRRRPLPRPVFRAALGVDCCVPVLFGTVGRGRCRIAPQPAGQQAYRSVIVPHHLRRADGRVVRRDQGGDTVSEGQAYAMLLAVAMDDDVTRSTRSGVGRETTSAAGRPAGLAVVGRAVISTRPPPTRDLDAAQALVLASERFGRPSYPRPGGQRSRGRSSTTRRSQPPAETRARRRAVGATTGGRQPELFLAARLR